MADSYALLYQPSGGMVIVWGVQARWQMASDPHSGRGVRRREMLNSVWQRLVSQPSSKVGVYTQAMLARADKATVVCPAQKVS